MLTPYRISAQFHLDRFPLEEQCQAEAGSGNPEQGDQDAKTKYCKTESELCLQRTLGEGCLAGG